MNIQKGLNRSWFDAIRARLPHGPGLGVLWAGEAGEVDPLRPARRADSVVESKWRQTVRRRSLVALSVMGLWVAVLQARLVQLQVFQHDERLAEATAQQESSFNLYATRGDIVDRHNRPMAFSVQADAIVADPKLVKDARKTASAICAALGDCAQKDLEELERRLSARSRFQYLRRSREVMPEQVARVAALGLPGIVLQADPRRYYPNRELASQVLGYVGQDNNGQAGVEYSFNKLIKGEDGRAFAQVDAHRQRLETTVEQAPVPGATIELSIDLVLQHIVERELRDGVDASKAQGGCAIVMDPYTGEILAMASYPTFNPNGASRIPIEDKSKSNRCVADVYEPGSTFKIVTASAALEGHVIQPDDMIDTSPGYVLIKGRPRPIRDTAYHGIISFEDVIILSSNVGAVKIGLRTGLERMTQYVQRFGFGRLLAADLPGGSRGIWNASNLGESGLASVSMGYQVSVTPLQMVTAVSAVANGGMLMQPHVVRAGVRDGRRQVVEPRALNRAISADTAAVLTTMMEGVVDRGTATRAKIEGYPSAGKTGTASRLVAGRYSKTDYNASFVGFVPSRRPMFTIIVVIDTPRVGGYYGGTIAAPIYKRIAEAALQRAGVPSPISPAPPVMLPDQPIQLPSQRPNAPLLVRTSASTAAGLDVMPNLRGLSAREALRALGRIGLTPHMSGSGFVVRQQPEAGLAVDPGGWARIDLDRNPPLEDATQ